MVFDLKKIKKKKSLFLFSWKDFFITVLILGATTLISFLIKLFDGSDMGVPILFILAVFLVSRYTNGYLFGVVSSFICVVLVNYIFTYPYFEFNFTITGYPIAFISMFATSVMTSAMTTRIMQQEKVRAEAEKEKMRGNLLRAVSHDLRTPLTSIVGTTSALLENDDKFSAEQRKLLLKESHDDAEWLIRMLENLLSITRMNGGEAQITKSPEAVEEITSEAIRKFNKRFPDANVAVKVPETLLMVPMDAILIEQVLINLLENSVVHGHSLSGISLQVSTDSGNAVFSVLDKGDGISEQVFPHLFDGYYSVGEKDESDRKRNMGIGLSVCMSIVKVHGGDMFAENNIGGGAKFSFTLPLETKETI